MHEVGHVLEECLDLPFSEERVERLVASFEARYGTPPAKSRKQRQPPRLRRRR
jgi:hypothetical protein